MTGVTHRAGEAYPVEYPGHLFIEIIQVRLLYSYSEKANQTTVYEYIKSFDWRISEYKF